MNDAAKGHEVSKDSPCPICHKPDWCFHLPDGAVVCQRKETAPPGWTIAKRRSKDGRPIFQPPRQHLVERERPAIARWQRTGKHDKQTGAFELEIIFQYSLTQRVPRRQWSDRRAVYKDRGGNLKTKFVRPQHKEGNRWKYGRGPDPWPLYHEDDIRSSETVLVVGGETCVEKLRDWGFSTTCNQGGEGKYIDQTAQRLSERRPASVVIWPDHDPPGYAAAEALLQACQEQGMRAAILDPLSLNPDAPPKWDVADWDIAADEAKIQIRTAVAQLTFISPTPPQQKNSAGRGTPKLAQRYQQVEAVLADQLRFNQLTNQIELSGQVVEDPADLRLTLALEHDIEISANDCDTIIKRLALLNSYHPVEAYLEHCEESHGPSTDVLDNFVQRYFGCDERMYQTFLQKTLVAAVARVFDAGCKVDTALILSGPQGIRKSSFFRVLAGAEWFDDSMGAATSERDERLKLHQFWILEWGELETVFRKKDIAAVKAFLTSSVDTVRPPYGRNAIRLKRQSIIVGTTNQDEFLTDATGNRRFWVIPVKRTIDLEQLTVERDQIWAAAVALYRSGYQWWLSTDEEAVLAEYNEFYRTEDPWLVAISGYLADNSRDEITTTELLTHALNIEPGAQTRGDQMRAGEVLRSFSWTATRRIMGDKRRRVWVAPEVSQPNQTGQPPLTDQPQQLSVQGLSIPECPARPGIEVTDPTWTSFTTEESEFPSNGHSDTHNIRPLSDTELATLLEDGGPDDA